MDFWQNNQKIFYQKVNKMAKPHPLRITAVINRVLIFRGLKRLKGRIFSYSAHEFLGGVHKKLTFKHHG
jgi:hypothetical protein